MPVCIPRALRTNSTIKDAFECTGDDLKNATSELATASGHVRQGNTDDMKKEFEGRIYDIVPDDWYCDVYDATQMNSLRNA